MFRKFRLVILTLIVAALLVPLLTACAGKGKPSDPQGEQTTAVVQEESTKTPQPPSQTAPAEIEEPDSSGESDVAEDQWYYDKEHVAAYIDQFGKLPGNYMTKQEARKLGWSGGSLDRYAKGRVIGGDYFGNREGLLPEKSGRKYYECDIDTEGRSQRGAKRIIYSNDGLIYYTDDHYRSFTLLYGEE